MRAKDHSCSATGCASVARGNANGTFLCGAHYQRWAKFGSTELPIRRKSEDGHCTAPGCSNPVRSGYAAFCETHYYRLRRGSKAGLGEIRKQCLKCESPLRLNQSLFCSQVCQTRHQRGTPNTRTCKICNGKFPTWERAEVCSAKCHTALKRGNGHQRRARLRGAEREIFSAEEIFERDRWVCQLCGKKTKRNVPPRHNDAPSLDHILPIKLGGGHTRTNTQCAHLMCNFIKQGRAIGQLRMFG